MGDSVTSKRNLQPICGIRQLLQTSWQVMPASCEERTNNMELVQRNSNTQNRCTTLFLKNDFSQMLSADNSKVPTSTNHVSCKLKSQFWRRHLCQYWKQLLHTRRFQNQTKVFCIIIIIFVSLLFQVPLCKADNNNGGNILSNLNNDRNSGATRPECKLDVPHCEPISNATTCFGVTLPYSHTTTQLVSDSENQQDVQRNLVMWQGKEFGLISCRIRD